jgi:hypothetical protein
MRVRSERRKLAERRGQGCAAAIGAVLVVAWAAGCGKEGVPSAGKETLLDEVPGEPRELSDLSPREQAPDPFPSDGDNRERPVVPGLQPRGVSDFEIEAAQDTPRAPDARGLGGACQSTADCQPGLGCATVVYSGAAQSQIAGGYCSRWCEQDAECAALDGSARCIVGLQGSDLNLCARGCRTGETEGESKCGGRPDLSCGGTPAPGIDAACLPRCTSHADCAVGRCSAGHGLCDVGLTSLAAPIGGECRVSAEGSCVGVCSPSAPNSDSGVCTGYCRIGSTCGQGAGTICAPRDFGQREGDTGACEQGCSTSQDCRAGDTACAPTGLLLPSGEPQRGCAQSYEAPQNLARQRLSVEQLELATLPSGVINVSTESIFEVLSHRLDVQGGAVCVTGEVVGELGAILELDFQLAPNNGSPLDASGFSAFSFDAEGPHVVRLDAYISGASYRYLTAARDAGDVGEGPQRIEFDELFNIYAPGSAPFSSLDERQLQAVRFTLIFEDGATPFRFCVGNFALQGPAVAPDAGL